MPCLQALQWCTDIFPAMTQHLDEYSNPAEFELDEHAAAELQQVVWGRAFLPFLTLLDADQERVAERKRRLEERTQMRESLRRHSLKQLYEWKRDSVSECEEINYGMDFPRPSLPISYSNLQLLYEHDDAEGKDNTVISVLVRCAIGTTKSTTCNDNSRTSKKGRPVNRTRTCARNIPTSESATTTCTTCRWTRNHRASPGVEM